MLRAPSDVLERWLVVGAFIGIVVPVAFVGATVVAKGLSSPRRFELEDLNVGTNLLLTAIGSELGAMVLLAEEKHESIGVVRTQLDLGFAVMLLLVWILAAFTLYMRAWGYNGARLKLLQGVVFPIGVGMVALVGVYGINAHLWVP